MNCYSFSTEKTSQIIVCGVDDAGKRTFISLFFPVQKNIRKTKMHIKRQAKRLLIIIILDGIHLQNVEEATLLQSIKDTFSNRKSISLSLLMILGKTDLFYNYRHDPRLIKDIFQKYKQYLDDFNCSQRVFLAFSALATKISRDLLSRDIDCDDSDDVKVLLGKIGRHLPENISPEDTKRYIFAHKNAFSVLSGEKHIQHFLQEWEGK